MPFITQGKTNLTYLLIVVVLGILVGGGILGYYYLWTKDLEVKLAELEVRLTEVKSPELKAPEEPSIKLISPNGGGELKIGTPHTISWEVMLPEGFKAESWVNVFLEKEGALEFGRLNKFGVFTPRDSFVWDGSQYFIDTPEGGRTYHQVEPGDGYKIKLFFVWDPSPPQYKVKVKSVEDSSDETFSLVE